MALVDLESSYKSAPVDLTPKPAAQPQHTWNSEYQAWQDASGNLWDEKSGLWYDPKAKRIWNENTTGWQTPDEMQSYWDTIAQHDAGISGIIDAAPQGQATYTPNPDFVKEWMTFDRNTVAPTGEYPEPTLSQYLTGAAQGFKTAVEKANSYSLSNMPSMLAPTEEERRSGTNFDLYPGSDGDGNYAANVLGKGYSTANKYFFDPVAETGAQLTPSLLKSAGSQALGPGFELGSNLAASLGGYDINKNEQAGLKELGTALKTSGGNPLSFAELQQENLRERPAWQQMGASTIYDPTNLIGAGLGAKALKAGAFDSPGTLSAILKAGAKVDKGIDVAQTAMFKPLGKALAPLASETGSASANVAAKVAAGTAAGAGTYAYNSEDDPKERLAKSLAAALGVAAGPDVLRAGYGKVPKRAKTPVNYSVMAAYASPDPVKLGETEARRLLALKYETTSGPGTLGKTVGELPGVKGAAAVVNPSITLDPSVHIANQASYAAQAIESTRLAATRQPLLDQIEDAFGPLSKSPDGSTRGAKAVEYIGPSDRPSILVGTIPDMKENPADYVLNPFQKATLDLWTTRDNIGVNYQRANYGTEVGLYHPENGGSYVPHINTNMDLVRQGLTTEARMSRPALSKPRSYETLADRMLNDDTFIPETDPRRLLEYHDNQLARMSGQKVFTLGAGGKTRVEVLEEVRPDLVASKKAAQAAVRSATGKLERRLEREGSIAAALRKTIAKRGQIDERLAPLEARVKVLQEAGDYGPELSHLAGQVYELRRQIAALERLVAGTKKKPGLAAAIVTNDQEIRALTRQVDVAQKKVEEVMDAYMNANITRDGYVRSDYTYRYHSPEVAESIRKVRSMPGDNKLLDAAVKAKGTALSSDGSPITQQGILQVFRDPWSAIKGWATIFLEGGASLDDVARREPEMVARFVQARARALGQVSNEFDPTHSLVANIGGGVGKKFVDVEASMFDAIQRVDYETWKSTRRLAGWLNPGVSSDVLDYEVANAISKSNPSLSSVDRGVSPARARVETAGLTSVSFMSAPALVLKDASSAIVKLTMGKRPRVREQVALAHAITMGTTLFGLSAASAAATADSRNLSPVEAVKRAMDPNKKDFMSLFLPGGKRLPLGGPYRSFIRAMYPLDSDGNLRAPDLLGWSRARIAPAGGAILDAVQNKDFAGDKIRDGNSFSQITDSVYYLVEQGLMPLSIGGAAEEARKGGSLGDVVTEFLGQTMGNEPQVYTPTDRLDIIARGWEDNGGKGFYDSPPSVQAAIKDQYPDLWKQAVEAGSDERKAAFELEQKLLDEQRTSDAKLANNDMTAADWRELYHDRYDRLRHEKGGIYALTEFEIKGDPRLEGYYDAIQSATGPEGVVDWDRVEAHMASLSADDRDFIETNSGLALRTETTKQYRADMKKIEDAGYWGVSDEVWSFFAQEFDVGFSANAAEYWTAMRKDLIQYADAQLTKQYGEAWRANTPNAAIELGDVAFNKVKGKYDDALAKARKAWRAEHPAEAQLLAKWQLGGTGQAETLERIDKANR